jgi:gas vesicle protein
MDKNFFGGFIVGIAFGFLFSILSTPEEGVLFRKKIINKIENQIDKFSDSTRKMINIINDNNKSDFAIDEEIH